MAAAQDLVKKLLARNRLALARLISKIEARDHDLGGIIRELYPHTGQARIVGVTGPPGAGKSTLVDGLATYYREQNKRVAVVAVDPTSPFTGGAILGDRVRMQKHYEDPDVFIRSLGTRGKHGGLSHATKEVVLALDAAGFDFVLVETAGVGQTELEILKLAQTVLVILVPESGDGIQVMKAGLMEIADLFAVNKADRPEADKLVKEIKNMLAMGHHTDWKIPIQKTEAVRSKGVSELARALDQHYEFLSQGDGLARRSERFLRHEIIDILTERLNRNLDSALEDPQGREMLAKVVARKMDPYQAAEKLQATLGE